MNSKVSVEMIKPPTQEWVRFSTGVAWGTVALFIAVVLSYVAMITAIASGSMNLPVGTVVATVLLYLAFTVVHEAGHGNIAHEVEWMKPYERAMGWSLTVPFLLIPFAMFARIHDYHHAFTNDPDKDPDHWISGNSWREASLKAFTVILNYVYLVATKFKHDPVIAQTHKSSLIYYSVSVSLVVGLVASGFGVELLMVGIIPAFLASYVLGMLFDWIPHMPTRQQGRYQNTRTYLFPGLKYLTLGQNYHHIHHLYPRVSWYHYHRVFNLIRPELEAKNSPIEELFSKELPGFGKSLFAKEPCSIDGVQKLTLSVESIRQLTKDSIAISFVNMNGKALKFRAGQYVTLSKRLGGETITRCYSICESPYDNKLSVGVKRVENGLLSSYLNNDLKIGDELTVAGPFGNFGDGVVSNQEKHITLIAGGSGITPVFSILKTVLAQHDTKDVHLIYANRSHKDVMFSRDIELLAKQYQDRLSVTYIYEGKHQGWEGYTGFLTSDNLPEILHKHNTSLAGQFYICGPEPMKNAVVLSLEKLAINPADIHVEEFVQKTTQPSGVVHQVSVELLNGIVHQLNVAENQTVLEVANQQGIMIPQACGVGQCGCCMMKVASGSVELAVEDTPGLLPGEKQQGLTLACQCMPRSELNLKEKTSIQ